MKILYKITNTEANTKIGEGYTVKRAIIICIISVFFNTHLQSFSIRPVPWITEEAIQFLELFLERVPNARVLEFGCGASTLWLAQRTAHLVSIEHNGEWYAIIEEHLKNTALYNPVNLILYPQPYAQLCQQFPDEYFDLVLVDGRNRKACIMESIRTLKKGGVLMLDNAERSWYHPVIETYLKTWFFTKTTQTKPDSCGFWYPNWQTNWWTKPL